MSALSGWEHGATAVDVSIKIKAWSIKSHFRTVVRSISKENCLKPFGHAHAKSTGAIDSVSMAANPKLVCDHKDYFVRLFFV